MAKTSARPRRSPEEARRLILAAAGELIVETGPEGLKLQQVAARAGISHPLILHHFGSRAGLVRALTQQAAGELRDRLVAAMASSEVTVEQQLDQVFAAFRDGLAQRLAWLAVAGEDDEPADAPQIMRDIAALVQARRAAAAAPGAVIDRADTAWLIHLVAAAAFGDAIFGPRLRRSAGLPAEDPAGHGFREWLAALICEHGRRSPPKQEFAEDFLASPDETPV